MQNTPVLQTIEKLVENIIDPSDEVFGKIAFATFDVSMALPLSVGQLHPSHRGRPNLQHKADAMVRVICGQEKIQVQQGTARAKKTNDLMAHSMLVVVAHHLLHSLIILRKAVCGDRFSQQTKFLCHGKESHKWWLYSKYTSLQATTLYQDVLNTEVAYALGNPCLAMSNMHVGGVCGVGLGVCACIVFGIDCVCV